MQHLVLILCCIAAMPSVAETTLDYPPAVKSVIEQRCVTCHGCYDAPCQLKLDAWIGLGRGASKEEIYDGERLRELRLSRLFEDAHNVDAWREAGFYPVLNDKQPARGSLYRMLAMKKAQPAPATGKLPDSFDFSLDRDQQCPRAGEFEDYQAQRPLWGMPYALPGLSERESRTLLGWLDAGAHGVALPARPVEEQRAVMRWETFFNGANPRQQLVSRYMFEHLFVADLYFDDLAAPSVYYKLVRSRTASGQPIDIIATRRPYDDPGAAPFYYRLQHRPTTVLDKSHMPYVLNPARMARWQELFYEEEYPVGKLPGYRTAGAYNPFEVFAALPVNSRYRFMLEEARFTITGFIKGPVCRGQVALNVIDDHFWVAFIKPGSVDPQHQSQFLELEEKNLRLPGGERGVMVSLLNWQSYAIRQRNLLRAQAKYIGYAVDTGLLEISEDLIWDGDGDNTNAALTIFRHFDSASVLEGFVGGEPKTAWIVGYTLLERIHYLLVAGFDVYGKLGHQLEQRLYMDFLRMEGEQAFLLFLPEARRQALRNYWYRDASTEVRDFVFSPKNEKYERDTAIDYQTDNPQAEFYRLLKQRLPGAEDHRYLVEDARLASLQNGPAPAFSFMPEVSFLSVLDPNGVGKAYTLIHNAAHSNNAQMFEEAERRMPAEDTLTVVRGLVGSYPNMFFQVDDSSLPGFIAALKKLATPEDFTRLVERHGIRRNDARFWQINDQFNAESRALAPVEAGLFDLNRYENH